MRRIRIGFGILIIFAGIFIFFYPYVAEAWLDYQTQSFVREFQETWGNAESREDSENAASAGTDDGEASNTEADDENEEAFVAAQDEDALYAQCEAYNAQIYEESQAGLCDAWSYEQMSIDVELESFGYIEIPAMDVVLPLYLGASKENMAAGAAVMGQTSIPIGGENTNAVIAGHRGYRGAPYFREIERLSVGDEVYVTNPWGTLTYVVTAIDIIDPDDADAVKIVEGKDMITLLTCHPYRSSGKYRYVVYCERADTNAGVTSGSTDANTGGTSGGAQSTAVSGDGGTDSGGTVDSGTVNGADGTITASDGRIYALSGYDIEREKIFRFLAAGLIFVMVAVTGLISFKRARKSG